MTSREALNKIQHNLDGKLKGTELVNCYEIIEKDLELLDLLKEIIPIEAIYFYTNDDELRVDFNSCSADVTVEEGEQIRAWLKRK